MAYDNRKGRIKDIAKRFENAYGMGRFSSLRLSAEFFASHANDPEGWGAYNHILGPINDTNSFDERLLTHVRERIAKAEEPKAPKLELVVDKAVA